MSYSLFGLAYNARIFKQDQYLPSDKSLTTSFRPNFYSVQSDLQNFFSQFDWNGMKKKTWLCLNTPYFIWSYCEQNDDFFFSGNNVQQRTTSSNRKSKGTEFFFYLSLIGMEWQHVLLLLKLLWTQWWKLLFCSLWKQGSTKNNFLKEKR